MTASLGARAARGAAVTLAGQLVKTAVQLIAIVVLARLLEPRDYGLIAMVLAVVNFGDLFRDFGLSAAAIRAPKLSDAERDNLFWANALIGLALGAALFACAPLVARAYGEPELEALSRVLAAVFVLSGLTTQYRASLIRALRFKVVTIIEASAAALGLVVAIVAALGGIGVWALAIQSLTASALIVAGMVAAARWFPRRPRRDVSIRGFLGFGGNLLASQVVGYAATNVDTWTVGIRFGPSMLGIYSRAFQLVMVPVGQVRGPSTSVALPVLTRIDEDQPRYDEFLRKGQLALALPVGIAMAFVIGAAPAVVALALGDQWSETVPFLRLFAAAALFQTITYVGYWVFLARGLTRQLLHYTVLEASIRIAAVLVGSIWGTLGVAVGYALAPALCIPLSLWWLRRHTLFPARDLFVNALRIIALAAALAGATFAAAQVSSGLPPVVTLVLAVGALAIVLALALLLPAVRNDLRDVLMMARLVRRRTGIG